jgi:predicted glycosyltransferase
MQKKTVLCCILNWGLGHATRSIPIVKAMLVRGHAVVIASTGRSLALLERELPACTFVDLPDYGVRYPRGRNGLVPFVLMQMPVIFRRLIREHAETEILADRFGADAVLSDNRYGCCSRRAPSYFMTHQLRFQLPRGLRWSAFVSEWFNRWIFRRYQAVFVPDDKGSPNLSGALSHSGRIAGHSKVHHIGPLSSLSDQGRPTDEQDLDFLFLVSGPEPQRTVFETALTGQIGRLPGEKTVVLGKPELDETAGSAAGTDMVVIPHADRVSLARLMNRARLVVSRSGYSTLMELAALGKRAVVIPTPGQTEQIYLAEHAMESGFFYSVPQHRLDLVQAIRDAERFYARPLPSLRFNRVEEVMRRMEL